MIVELLVIIQLVVFVVVLYKLWNGQALKDNQIMELEKENSKLRAENDYLKKYSEQIQTELKLYFENYTNEFTHQIVKSKAEILKQETTANINTLLLPLRDKIAEFQQKVEKTYHNESREIFSLKNEIQNLLVNNTNMIKETVNLTNALKGSVKAQGTWGELILEKILESSGLTKGIEYITQGTDLKLKNDENKIIRPDVIINLPDDKHLIIDAKVSLKHYEQYLDSLSGENRDSSAQENLALFIKSIQNHINNLSSKDYQHNEKLLSPDFVLMFFPIEGAFSLALQTMPDLLMQAWNNKVVIVSPTTLFATLKTIASIWVFEKQNKNAQKIARESGLLYDKLVAFTEDLSKVGHAISKADEVYHQAINKLTTGRGNIIAKTEKIKQLGAKAKKQLANEWKNKSENLIGSADDNNNSSDDNNSNVFTVNDTERELLHD